MLERYFIRPDTVDRIRSSWLGEPIERYVTWLSENQYSPRNVFRRVPILVQFARFAWDRGCRQWTELPAVVVPFAASWEHEHGGGSKADKARDKIYNSAISPVRQMLALLLPGFQGKGPARPEPFSVLAPGFFIYLREERGLRPCSIRQYSYSLQRLVAYFEKLGCSQLSELSPFCLALSSQNATNRWARTG